MKCYYFFMDILVATNDLANTAGTQTYTYAIIQELLKLGHKVEYFAFDNGLVSKRIEKLGVRFMAKENYDLILANHKPIVQRLFQHGYIIQTTHGIIPGIEEPSSFADFHVCVSEYQKKYFSEMKIKMDVIKNGIDCERFRIERPIHDKLTNVLSLCKSEEAIKLVVSCCKKIKVECKIIRHWKDHLWEIEKEINRADLVIGVGRSLFDAMACGRAVISYDTRYKDRNFEGDGYLDKSNIKNSIVYNCCGGFNRRFFNQDELIFELKKYNSDDGLYMREVALDELNISKSVEKYLNIYNENKHKKEKDEKLTACYKEIYDEIDSIRSSYSWRITKPLRKIKSIIKWFI